LLEASVPVDAADLTHMVQTVPTITDLAVLFPFPAEFALNFSRLSLAPVLEHIWSVLPKDPLEIQNLFMQAIESRWQSGRLKSVKIESAEFAPGILDRMSLLESQGMLSTVFPLNQDSLRRDVVPSDFLTQTE
jgi:hypothetical protein